MQSLMPIMLIEDTGDDFEAMLRALRKAGVANPVFRFSRGEEALDYLRGRGRFYKPGSSVRPGLILLDLNLPGTTGLEVLAIIKQDTSTRSIPVVIVSSSKDAADVEAAYGAGASSFIQKPLDLEGFVDVVRKLKEYWFEMVILPRTEVEDS